MAEPGDLRDRRRQARNAVAQLRTQSRWWIVLGGVWAVIAVGRFATGSGPAWLQWLTAAAALCFLGDGLRQRRRLRREQARLAELVGVELRPVTEATLSRIVAAAMEGATADEVTPPITPGTAWTEERVEWLRAFHRDRRRGLAGPEREATWAVVEVDDDGGPDDGRVVGGLRLRRTGDPDVLETGIWLARDARGRGIGAQAMRLVLGRARQAGARTVRAETTTAHASAVGLLRALGAVITVDGDAVRAEIPLAGPDAAPG